MPQGEHLQWFDLAEIDSNEDDDDGGELQRLHANAFKDRNDT